MEIVEKKLDNVNILCLSGRLDAYSSTELEKKLESLIKASQPHVVIDFQNLEYISSSGLRVLLMALKKTRKLEGDIKLACMQSFIKEVFDMAGFSQLFNIFDTDEAAVRHFIEA